MASRPRLPSIHEMFPEHLMHDSLCNPRPYPGADNSSNVVLRPAADPNHVHRARGISSRSPPPPLPVPRERRSVEHDPRPRAATAPSYSFEVLKSTPKTSSLEHIASSSTYRQRSASDPQALSSSQVHDHDTRARGVYGVLRPAQGPFRSIPAPSSSSPFVLSRLPIMNERPESERDHGRLQDTRFEGEEDQGSYNGEVRKHVCPHCAKRFNRPSSLRIHINIHTNARPFSCPFPHCGRMFNVNSNMRRHYRNHTRGAAETSTFQHTYNSFGGGVPSSPSSGGEDETMEGDDSAGESNYELEHRRSPPPPPSRAGGSNHRMSPPYPTVPRAYYSAPSTSYVRTFREVG